MRPVTVATPLQRGSPRLLVVLLSAMGVMLVSFASMQKSFQLLSENAAETGASIMPSSVDRPSTDGVQMPSIGRRLSKEISSPMDENQSAASTNATQQPVHAERTVNPWWIGNSEPSSSPNPCESMDSLKSYLDSHQKLGHKYSQANPICPGAASHHMHVLIPFSNLEESTLRNAVDSVQHQDYPQDRITLWVYQDGPSQEHPNVLSNVCGTELVKQFTPATDVSQAQQYTRQYTKAQELNNTSNRICIQSTQHLGIAGSKFWGLQLIQTVAKPNEVVLLVEGHDQLLHARALSIINQKYLDQSAWFTYGSMQGKWAARTKDLRKSIRQHQRDFTPRDDPWLYGHPRTYKAHLLTHLTPHDFQYHDGSWLLVDDERGMLYRLLELAGPDRIGYIADQIYLQNEPSTVAVHAEVEKAHKDHAKFTMIRSRQLVLPITIVLVVGQHLSLLKDQLSWLQKQAYLEDRPLQVHLLNHHVAQQEGVDQAAQEWSQAYHNGLMRGSPTWWLSSMQVTVVHYTSKLEYIHTLRQTTPLDEVMVLGGNQFWAQTFVSGLLQVHKPRSTTAWLGKTFANQQQQDSNAIAKWDQPDLTLRKLALGVNWPGASHFKYASGQGAIYDANLWLLPHKLLSAQSAKPQQEQEEDLWVSYVLDALLGWEIRRLSPEYLPFDMKEYQSNKYYRIEMARRKLGKSLQTYLDGKFMGIGRPDLTANGTRAVDDEDAGDLFQELQETFQWDVFPSLGAAIPNQEADKREQMDETPAANESKDTGSQSQEDTTEEQTSKASSVSKAMKEMRQQAEAVRGAQMGENAKLEPTLPPALRYT